MNEKLRKEFDSKVFKLNMALRKEHMEKRGWMDAHDKMVAKYARLQDKAEKLVEALEDVGNIIGGPIAGYLAPRNNEQSSLIEKASKKVQKALASWQ